MLITHYMMQIDGDQSILFVVLKDNSDLIASCHLFPDGTLVNFHVAEKERLSKVGKYLFEYVKFYAYKYGIYTISCHVEKINSAIDFWIKLGFVNHGTHPEYDDCYFVSIKL